MPDSQAILLVSSLALFRMGPVARGRNKQREANDVSTGRTKRKGAPASAISTPFFFFFFFATPTDHQSPVDGESIAGLRPPFRRVFFLALQIALFAQIFLFCEMGLNTANLVKEPCHLRRKDSSFLCVFLNLAETASQRRYFSPSLFLSCFGSAFSSFQSEMKPHTTSFCTGKTMNSGLWDCRSKKSILLCCVLAATFLESLTEKLP